MAGINELLERDFKKKYPHRNEPTRKGRLKIQEKDGSFTYKDYEVPNHFDFWYHWTDGYIEFLTTHNYKFLEWLSNDTERVGALEEIKKEVEHRLPPRYPHKAEILEFVEWKIKQILDLQASAKTGATTLPDGLNTPEVRNLLNKAIEAGYLNDNYQPIGILLNENKTPNYAYLTAFVNAFNEVYFKPKRQRPHWSDFQKLWDIKQDLASRNSQYDGGNSTKFSINFEELKSELVKLWRNS